MSTSIPTSNVRTAPGDRHRHDVIVVGGRLGGAATAMLLARAGADVLVLERAHRGADTLSTHALMRAGVHQLARWGVLDAVIAAGTPVVRTVAFHHPDLSFTIPVKPGPGYEGLYAPRRTVLDRVLVEAAEGAGAAVHFGARVASVLQDDGRVTGVGWRDANGRTHTATARLIIGADGTGSLVARSVAAPTLRQGHNVTGLAYTYVRGVDVVGYEWGFAPAGASGLIPTNDGAVLVFAGVPGHAFADRFAGDVEAGFWSVLEEVTPTIAARVRAGWRVERFRSFPGRPGHLRQAYGPGWALVGDAGYFKDPISAHGMTDALRDADLLTDAVVAVLAGADEHEALAAYQRRRDALSTALFDVTEAIAAHGHEPERCRELLLELSDAMTGEMDELSGRAPTATSEAAA